MTSAAATGEIATIAVNGQLCVKKADIARFLFEDDKERALGSTTLGIYCERQLGPTFKVEKGPNRGWFIPVAKADEAADFAYNPENVREAKARLFGGIRSRKIKRAEALSATSPTEEPMTIHRPSLPPLAAAPVPSFTVAVVTPTLAQILALASVSTINKIVVTPELARELLTIDTNNRKVSQSRVDHYAGEMKRGNWKFNGATMCVRKDGVIGDGGHRLRACVQSGVPFETTLVTGIEPDAICTIDRGRSRSIADDLTMNGEKNTTTLQAALRNLWIFAEWDFAAVLSPTEANQLLSRRPSIRDSVNKAIKVKVVPPSMIAALHYIGTHIQDKPLEANAFLDVMITGIPQFVGDPAQLVRERFLSDKRAKKKANTSVKYKLLAHTWNLFIEKTSVSRVVTPQSVSLDGWDLDAFNKGE